MPLRLLRRWTHQSPWRTTRIRPRRPCETMARLGAPGPPRSATPHSREPSRRTTLLVAPRRRAVSGRQEHGAGPPESGRDALVANAACRHPGDTPGRTLRWREHAASIGQGASGVGGATSLVAWWSKPPSSRWVVGEAGFEPAASCSQSRRANQAAPLPVHRERQGAERTCGRAHLRTSQTTKPA